MAIKNRVIPEISANLIEAIQNFPTAREVEHCGTAFSISPFDFYAHCPLCHEKIKVRAYSAIPEIEDVFDAVFSWMNNPDAHKVAENRQKALANEEDE